MVTTSNSNVLATAYVRPGKSLIAVASWNASSANVTLNVSLSKIGLSANALKVSIPSIAGYQASTPFQLNSALTVAPQKGWLVLLESPTTGIEDENMDGVFFDVAPNPTADFINVTYRINRKDNVNIELYDINGKELIHMQNGILDKGDYLASFSCSDLPNGIYICILKTSQFAKTKRIVVAK